jgi:hypothetical protein
MIVLSLLISTTACTKGDADEDVRTPAVIHAEISGGEPWFKLEGTVIQLTGRSDLNSVNAALRAAVARDQEFSKEVARKGFPEGLGLDIRNNGVKYSITPLEYSVSSSMVSVLYHVELRRLDEGPSGKHWRSVTLAIPSAKTIAVSDLFAEPVNGMKNFGDFSKALVGSECGSDRPNILPVSDKFYQASFYSDFALTPIGLVLGISIYTYSNYVGIVKSTSEYDEYDSVCHIPKLTISWSEIDRFLSDRAKGWKADLSTTRWRAFRVV